MNYSIEPLNYGRLGTADKFQVAIGAMAPNATKCSITWQVGQEVPVGDHSALPVGVTPRFAFKNLDAGQLWLDGEAFENWAADNYYVVQWAAAQLGFTLL